MPLKKCTPEKLRAAVEEVLGDPRYRQAAARLAVLLREAPGPAGAADLLEGISLNANGRGGSDDSRLQTKL